MICGIPFALETRVRDWTCAHAGLQLNDRVRAPSTETSVGREGWVWDYQTDGRVEVRFDDGQVEAISPAHLILVGHDPGYELRYWLARAWEMGLPTRKEGTLEHGEACGLSSEQSAEVWRSMDAWRSREESIDV